MNIQSQKLTTCNIRRRRCHRLCTAKNNNKTVWLLLLLVVCSVCSLMPPPLSHIHRQITRTCRKACATLQLLLWMLLQHVAAVYACHAYSRRAATVVAIAGCSFASIVMSHRERAHADSSGRHLRAVLQLMRMRRRRCQRVTVGGQMGMQSHSGYIHCGHGIHRVQRVLQVQSRLQLGLRIQQLAVVCMLHAAHYIRIAALLVLFTFLCTSILEPDLNLSLWQWQRLRQLALPAYGYVSWRAILFLQLKTLEVCVNHTVFILGASFAYKKSEIRKIFVSFE